MRYKGKDNETLRWKLK